MRRVPLPSLARGVALLLVVALLAACGDDEPSTAPLPSGCAGDVAVSVSAGTTPTFTWTPACRVSRLLVERTADGADLWLIQPAGTQGIASGVQYGIVPPNATEASPAVPLATGSSYRVIVARELQGDQFVAGSANFTP